MLKDATKMHTIRLKNNHFFIIRVISGMFLCSRLTTEEMREPVLSTESLRPPPFFSRMPACINRQAYVGLGKTTKALTSV